MEDSLNVSQVNFKFIADKHVKNDEFYVDGQKIQQIFLNMLVSAIRMSGANGKIKVNTNVVQNESLTKTFNLKVKNTGFSYSKREIDFINSSQPMRILQSNVSKTKVMGLKYCKSISD